MDLMQYPIGTPVLVKYPLTKGQERGDRAAWPWLPGVVEDVCGPDEWLIAVTSPEVATCEDGGPAQDSTPRNELYFPCCFRDSYEILTVAE
jgi:hypothetical protein